jgi:hypothetical protein
MTFSRSIRPTCRFNEPEVLYLDHESDILCRDTIIEPWINDYDIRNTCRHRAVAFGIAVGTVSDRVVAFTGSQVETWVKLP